MMREQAQRFVRRLARMSFELMWIFLVADAAVRGFYGLVSLYVVCYIVVHMFSGERFT